MHFGFKESAMNGVSAIGDYRGFPATAVLRLTPGKHVSASDRQAQGGEVVFAAVSHPPRGGEPRPLSALVPAVLAQYGLCSKSAASEGIDCLA
jgi:hypothetical protein